MMTVTATKKHCTSGALMITNYFLLLLLLLPLPHHLILNIIVLI
jgi:hypothetical protein